jgi:hypothetical protein
LQREDGFLLRDVHAAQRPLVRLRKRPLAGEAAEPA